MPPGRTWRELLGQRVAFHHSGLSYVQRAGLVEPLAKGGQLRVVVATLGLSAGINFSLRSVLVTGDELHRRRFSARSFAIRSAADVRPRGPARARRPGLRAGQRTLAAARPGARGPSAPQRAAALASAAAGTGARACPIAEACADVSEASSSPPSSFRSASNRRRTSTSRCPAG